MASPGQNNRRMERGKEGKDAAGVLAATVTFLGLLITALLALGRDIFESEFAHHPSMPATGLYVFTSIGLLCSIFASAVFTVISISRQPPPLLIDISLAAFAISLSLAIGAVIEILIVLLGGTLRSRPGMAFIAPVVALVITPLLLIGLVFLSQSTKEVAVACDTKIAELDNVAGQSLK